MKNMLVHFLTILFVLLILKIHCKERGKLPDYLKVCKRNPDTINNCVKNSLEQLRPYLKIGIPEFELPPVEPYIGTKITFFLGNVVNFKGVGNNIKVSGLTDYTFRSVKIDLEKLIFNGLIHFPKLRFEGDFDVDARLFVLPFHGSGHIDMNVTECLSDLTLYGKIERRKGKGYMKFRKVSMDLSLRYFNPKYENFYAGAFDISELLTQIMNTNKLQFFRAIKPFVESSASEYMRKISNRIAKTFPYDVFIPPQ